MDRVPDTHANRRTTNRHEIEIRAAGEKDAASVLHLLLEATAWLESRGHTYWSNTFTLEKAKEYFAQGPVFLAFAGSEPVGTVCICFDTPKFHIPEDSKFWSPGTGAFIRKLAVLGSHQELGVGSMLLTHAEEEIKRLGYDYARLNSNRFFLELVDYYSKRGYVLKGARDTANFFEKRLGA